MEEVFKEIDSLHSVTEMQKALTNLDEQIRKVVIIEGLKKSRFQF